MKTIAFFNNKGGVGKTSLVYHLAWMYARLGVNVLAADLDPQANLTSMFLDDGTLEPLWPETGERRTVYGALRPLLEGTGDIGNPYLVEPEPGLGLLVGDLLLAAAEDELSSQWPACLDRKPRAFRVLSALSRILRRGAAQVDAQLILVDVGPNLGAFNRAALVTADSVVVPLAPDLYSLQGLRNLGPTLRRWRNEWDERRERNPVPDLAVPEGAMRPIGYIVMQHAVRLDRPVKAYRRWMSRIPGVYRAAVADERPPSEDTTIDEDPHCLAALKHYRSLMPLAQEARKPMFALKPADGAIGGHVAAVRACYRDFRALAGTVLTRVGLSSLDGQGGSDPPSGESAPRERPAPITFRPLGPAPEPPPEGKLFTPARMADLARDLEEVIAKVEEWGIPVPGGSRLPQTAEHLQQVTSAQSFPESREGRCKTAHAAQDAQEFSIIGGMLPRQPLKPVVQALSRAVGGTIGVTPHPAYQAQSELWVGAALSCAGVSVGVLTKPNGASPDYIVRNDGKEYAIEVKRIASGSKVRQRVSKASEQVRGSRYDGGALVVDLTDWLPSDVTLRFAEGPPDLNSPHMRIARRIDQLRKEIFDDRTDRIRPRRMQLLAVTAFARFIHWDLTDPSQIHLTRYIAPLWFWQSGENRGDHRARWLAELLNDGVRNIGYQDLGAQEIRFRNPGA
ncbi:ParA family protein [Candidatus Palauibacter sp.]|uniref:ParA family protein n=1 Tax=Candidatus Palauibacter sp. TaxID=3101350 RepID=UPI003B02CA10